MASAEAFAKQILYWAGQHSADEDPTCITNMQLQKLLYYVQGWSLAEFQRPAFKDRIEAWQHGPVVPEVYRQYKASEAFPLTPVHIPPGDLDAHDRKLVDWVMSYYGQFSASRLRDMTHTERPWRVAWGPRRETDSGNDEITVESMREFFFEQQDSYLRRWGIDRVTMQRSREQARQGNTISFDEAVGRMTR